MKSILFLTVFICTSLAASSFSLESLFSDFSNGKITCRNELTGEELDWFTAYKMPKGTHQLDDYDYFDNDYLATGTAYALMTNMQQHWTYSTLSFNDTKSVAGQTLAPIYSPSWTNDNLGYILYNDQADKVTLIKGHTKGVILFDDNTAVWVVHSVPNFPPKKSAGEYLIHPPQCVFGQSMLCMTFRFDDLEQIGLQLLYNYPQVYDYNIPEKLFKGSKGTVLNNLIKVVNGEHITSQPYSNAINLNTLGGEQMIIFAKTSDFEEDLYAGLVAPKLQSNLLTETWNNGAGTLKSNCSENLTYHVNNIEELKLDFVQPGYGFSVHHDHSKWAVTKSNEGFFGIGAGHIANSRVQIACIGDINRQEEQLKRGGGTVCFANNANVWQAYSGLVDEIQECDKVAVYNHNMPKRKKIKFNISGEAIILV